MPKLLIIEPTIVNYGDDRGGVDQQTGDIVDVPKAVASTLTKKNRALYLEKKDDPTKAGLYTASPDLVKAAQAAAKAAKSAPADKGGEGEGGKQD